eukprot:717212_1
MALLQLNCLIASISGEPIFIEDHGFELDNYPIPDNTYLFTLSHWSKWTNGDSVLISNVWDSGATNPRGGTTFDDPIFSDGPPQGHQCAWTSTYPTHKGLGEFGIYQTLSAHITANTMYMLHLWVGNPATNTWSDSSSLPGLFVKDGFPGYRVQLLAGNEVIVEDNNTTFIEEGHWKQSNVSVIVRPDHPDIGKQIGVRLVNKNIPNYPAYGQVYFDNIVLEAIPLDPPPTNAPNTMPPSAPPTQNPSKSPTLYPVSNPTESPITAPTKNPVLDPTTSPITDKSTQNPTKRPTLNPLRNPVQNPTTLPTIPHPTLFAHQPSISYLHLTSQSTSISDAHTTNTESGIDLNVNPFTSLGTIVLVIIIAFICVTICVVGGLWFRKYKTQTMATQTQMAVATVTNGTENTLNQAPNTDDIGQDIDNSESEDSSESDGLYEVHHTTQGQEDNEPQTMGEGGVHETRGVINARTVMGGSAQRTKGADSEEAMHDMENRDPSLSDADDSNDLWANEGWNTQDTRM